MGITDSGAPVLMRLAHFDVTSGAAGDMLLASLLDAGAPMAAVRAGLAACGLAGEVALTLTEPMAGAFRVAHLEVSISAGARERQVPDALRAIDGSGLPARVREGARETIERIAAAEARLHGTPLSELHLHELSAADTLTDVVGFWVAVEALGIGTISASPINVGGGVVTFSHGRFGVPAPATGELLRGIPIVGSEDAAIELTTPTGAAILATAVSRFGAMPAMTVDRIGYAVGSRPTEPPQILRCYVGRS
jgi:uncharacterized protein (DUF111 family)